MSSLRERVAGGGPVLAAAGVLVAVAVSAVEFRMADEWGTGVFLVMNLLAAVAVLGAGLESARGDGRPDASATALLLAGLFLASAALMNLADVLGADGGSGAVTWVALVFAAIAGYCAWTRHSPISLLVAAIALAVAFFAAVDWIFDPEGIDTFRWLLALVAVGLAVAAARWPRTEGAAVGDAGYRESVQLVNAAGLAVLVLAASVPIEAFVATFQAAFVGSGGEFLIDGPVGWELVSLLGASALIAYAVWRREPGPGYLGAASLFFFVLTAAAPGEEASLVGWPLVLVALAAVAVASALRRPTGAGAPGPVDPDGPGGPPSPQAGSL